MENKFEVLSGRAQILRRPQMWIGSFDNSSKDVFVIENGKAIKKSVSYIPAFKKIQDEILDNSIDALVNSRNASGEIRVKMTEETVYIEDNGPGIPVIKNDASKITDKTISEEERKELSESYIPFSAWTRLFSGSNFQDSDNKTTIGSHGIGSKATAVFSIKFVGHTDDGKKYCHVVAENNLEKKSFKVGKSCGKTGTWVEFKPDLKRFNLERIEQVYFDLMYQRLLCLAITFPKIKFYFNGSKISINDKKFLGMFSDHVEFQTFDRGFVGIFPNESDEFSFFTYVNGLALTRGGTHVDFIVNQIVAPIRDKLCKKYKSLKPADIRNKFTAVIFLRDFPNTKFDSQTKETLTNSAAEVSKYLNGEIDFEKFAKQILKNDAIVNPIIETFKIKEELKSRQELKQSKKAKVRSDKYMAPIGEKKYLALCEGASAMSGISGCIGRKGIGYYACRGLAVNVVSSSIQKIAANQEFKDVMNILELDITKDAEKKTISFNKVMLTTDADVDGSHICAMLLGWFARFAPNLFEENKICRLVTPLIIIQDNKGKIIKYFLTLKEFKEYEKTGKQIKGKLTYLKGLGSWERSDLQYLIDTYGFDNFVFYYKMDPEGKIYLKHWLSDEEVDKRKEYIKSFEFDINAV